MVTTPKIAPSLLSSDFSHLYQEAKRMVDYGADYLHIDIMDGHFVPNLTIGAPVVKCLRQHTSAFFDCHMMVSEPEKWVDEFSKSGANMYCFHYEATKDPNNLIDQIHAHGMKAGVAIKPKTPPEAILNLKTSVDQILVMTVGKTFVSFESLLKVSEPGFGNQKFMENCIPKVQFLREKFPDVDIEVDGGISPLTVDRATKAGANVIVAGSAIFGSQSPKEVIDILRKSVVQNYAR